MRIEIRNNSVLLDGYVNAVERLSRVLPSPRGRFREKIAPKTFQRALMNATDVDLLFNHDPNIKLGSISQGNLQLFEDSIGLRAIARITDESVIESAKSGALQGWSFGFSVNADSWVDGEDGIQLRTVNDINLYEVSILTDVPAYIATSVEMRNNVVVLAERRQEGSEPIFEDNSEKTTKTNPSEETRNEPNYSVYESEFAILQLKGSSL
jgi:uncharacterized protein